MPLRLWKKVKEMWMVWTTGSVPKRKIKTINRLKGIKII